jgi:hypothetical protein
MGIAKSSADHYTIALNHTENGSGRWHEYVECGCGEEKTTVLQDAKSKFNFA